MYHPQHALCRFVDDCIAYLAGLVSTAEVLPVVRQQRDKMLTRVVIGALQQALDALGIRDFSKAMQVMRSVAADLCDCPELPDISGVNVRRHGAPSTKNFTVAKCRRSQMLGLWHKQWQHWMSTLCYGCGE